MRQPGETPGNPDFGPKWEPGGRRRPPNSDQEPIPNPHQLRGGGQKYDMSQTHKVGYGQAVVNWGTFGIGLEVFPALVPHAEPLILQIHLHIIQKGNSTKEVQQDQKPPLLFCLFIWKLPHEAMEDQSQTIRWINQVSLRYQTCDHNINLPYGLFPNRSHHSSLWWSNPDKILVSC